MLNKLRTKTRASIQDASKTSFESFTASGRTFTIAQSNVASVTSVTRNGTALATNKYAYDSSSQVVTIDADSVTTGDAIVIYYTYQKYSDTELDDYIRTALMYLDINQYGINFSIDSGDTELYPIPRPKEQSLIVIIATILIQPEHSEYRTANVMVRFPRTMTRDEKIAKVIAKFMMSREGYTGLLALDGEDY